MIYNNFLGNVIDTSSDPLNNLNSVKENRKFARVVYVVHDELSDFYKDYGRQDSINGIKYQLLGDGSTTIDPLNLPFAYPAETSFKTVPLIDEIVEIVDEPSNRLDELPKDKREYYRKVTNIFNNPLHNAFPSTYSRGKQAKLGDTVVEVDSIRPLQPFPGDVYVEGRLGQSLRFTGFDTDISPFTDNTNNGSPLTIIRNGQKLEEDVEKAVIEDVNLDDSSIYLTSNHIIPITLSRQVYNSFSTPEEKPTRGNVYKGRQIIVDSGRIILNAKDNDILLSSLKSTSISSDTVNLDANKYVGVEGNKIYLGSKSFNEQEPVLRGGKTAVWLEDLSKLLENIGQLLQLPAASPYEINAKLIRIGQALNNNFGLIDGKLRKEINPLKSTKVFTE